MREVTVFYAFDDTEFENREECLEYEKKTLEGLKEINEKYAFFDKDMNLYCAPLESPDIDEWMDWLCDAAEYCEFIYREADLSISTEWFLNREWGFCILNEDFNHQVGWFRYDSRANGWRMVGE